MYQGAVAALRHRLEIEAVVVSPLLLASNRQLTFCPAAHPTPDERSRRAAAIILKKLRRIDERTIVLFLISGGASAMVEQPLDPGISIADTARFNRVLVTSGLPIAEINTIRKHFSAVKGGRLACAAARAAAVCNLVASDVPSGSPDSVGSGPSLPDPTSCQDSLSTLNRVLETTPLPASVVSFFHGPLFVETPKPGDPIFARNHHANILSSDDLEAAASRSAGAARFHVVHDNTCDEWDYRKAAKYLLERASELRRHHPLLCLVSVGELSVPIEGPSGKGGRNQQFALWCAMELARRQEQMAVLSAGSDGIDGQSPAAAGAIADATTCGRAHQLNLDAQCFLSAYDSNSLFAALGDTIVTGPTGINLRDLRIVMSLPH
jgi:hydroxypyruvate reductase